MIDMTADRHLPRCPWPLCPAPASAEDSIASFRFHRHRDGPGRPVQPTGAIAKAGSGTAIHYRRRRSRLPARRRAARQELTASRPCRRRLETWTSVAVMNPTDANLLAQICALPKTGHGQESESVLGRWQRLVWTMPELDYSLSDDRPISRHGRRRIRRKQQAR